MLLFTWNSLWTKTGNLFEWTFSIMDGPNRNVNIVFIIIGFVGMIYWLSRQVKYNQAAEQNNTIK